MITHYLKLFWRHWGHLTVLGLFMTSMLYIGGSRIQFEKMPDIRPRILALFTDVPDGFVRVVDDIDGDTIVVLVDGKEETVRLLGVDTPETRDPKRPPQCYGRQASEFTKNQIIGKAVKLLPDPHEDDRDKYDRLLRYVYLEDGSMLNERLVFGGFAFAYERFPTVRLEILKKMEADARDHRRGLWADCTVTIKNGGKQKSTQNVNK